jgi:dTDP-L-rhamnose 4-epimerase
MRILITGAAGFIGSHIAESALACGHEVRGLDSMAPAVHDGVPGYWPAAAELITADIRDPSATGRALRGVQVVCHQAALVGLGVDLGDLPAYTDVNVTGTAVLLEQMSRQQVPRLVLASSMVVYGEGGYRCAAHGQVRPAVRERADLEQGRFEARCPRCGADLSTVEVPESAPLDPRNAYAVSKVAQEQLAAVWAAQTGGSAVALRYHNVYGPRMPRDTPYAGVAAIFRSALETGQAPRVFEDGAQRRDFVHVTDVAAANLAALPAGQPGRLHAYNVASGEPHTIWEMASALAGAFGGPLPRVTGEYRIGDVRHVVASPEVAWRELGFRAGTRFAAGMAQFARAPLREPARATAATPPALAPPPVLDTRPGRGERAIRRPG